ncbi:MAG: type 4a pilus biogenesis protein PilO [Nitrospirae bacterium]|nr:type 4a pilus biogenesis protein PilO [Nitrospirota bacterium]
MTSLDLKMPIAVQASLRRFLPLGLVTLTAVGCAAVVYVVIRGPALSRLEQAKTAYQSAKQTQDQLHRTRAFQEKARTAQQQVEDVWKELPTQNEFASFAMAISEVGRLEHVSIPGMAYHVEKAEGSLPVKATLTFKATGDYGAIYRFIHRLEMTEPYLVIESLDAARLDKSDRASSTLLVFNVKVATFLRPNSP